MAANIQIVKNLGANIKLPLPRKPILRRHCKSIEQEIKSKIADSFCPTRCYVLKLARNLLEQTPDGIFIKLFPQPAKWSYIVLLFEFQNRLGFRLANRLPRIHVYFDRHKIKVTLAIQVLSNSTAYVLRYIRDVQKKLKRSVTALH